MLGHVLGPGCRETRRAENRISMPGIVVLNLGSALRDSDSVGLGWGLALIFGSQNLGFFFFFNCNCFSLHYGASSSSHPQPNPPWAGLRESHLTVLTGLPQLML
jgi:hypothetical protein